MKVIVTYLAAVPSRYSRVELAIDGPYHPPAGFLRSKRQVHVRPIVPAESAMGAKRGCASEKTREWFKSPKSLSLPK
jgi:hypothetical protein